METTAGFYKLFEDGGWVYAPNFVISPTFELFKEQHETYTYPVDGWNWYDEAPAAYVEYIESQQPPSPPVEIL